MEPKNQVIWTIRLKVMAPNKSGLLAPTHENLDSTASTGQLEQKMTLFAIFRDVTGGTDTRKIVNNRSHIAKGAGSFHDIRKSMKKLCANDTSRYPKVLKIGPNHGCQ